MSSLILATIARVAVALMLLFSVFLLLRGHDAPGGGFLGGLVAAIGFILYVLAEGPREVRAALRVDPRSIAFVGLAVALVSGLAGLATGAPFLTALWTSFGDVKLGTPVLFDLGVYLVVVGGVLAMVLALEEEVG
ncbi:MAG: Na+/H+ antiporter subunit B [Proteobacteria bacterium]|nr:MAG: Na+/H+ antiporter subunit B [Pseudomonadota bacterium]